MDAIEFKNQLINLMRDISINMDTIFLPIISEYDLTIVQTQILREIKENKNHTIGSLARIMNIQSCNTSFTCKQLEKKGFIKRNRDKSDERVVNVELTEKGLITMDKIDNTLREKYSSILSNENPKELLAIIDGLQNLKDLLIKMSELKEI